MRVFNYDSFADLTRVFDARRGQVVPPRPKARVVLFSSTALRAQSRFVDLRAYRPAAKPSFVVVAQKKAAGLKGTLRLKSKVELPPALSPRSTVYDLAAAFKAEKAAVQKLAEGEATSLRRHAKSGKSWSELFAEAEAAAVRPKKDFDLGAALRAEMKSFEAGQDNLPRRKPAPLKLAI